MSPENTISKDSFVDSKPIDPLPSPVSTPNIGTPESPAAQQLAALNKKDAKKDGKSSRLRRAFSFGSAAELRKASAENNMASNERAKLRKERYHNEQEAAQARIAQKQEAAGLGEGIYSGQGHFFTGSTDNLSISSTASSASVMIRKMGKGMKKGSRSLVGLFRPKSVIGVPVADSAVPEPSVAQVSMVTVEAEREKVNVNVDPHDHAGGGTGYPKLERNSIDTASFSNEISTIAQEVSNDNYRPRVNITGGDKERAEVLSAVKKGILKRLFAVRSYFIVYANLAQAPPLVLTQGTPPPSRNPLMPKLPNLTPHSFLPSTIPQNQALPAHQPTIPPVWVTGGLILSPLRAKITFSHWLNSQAGIPRVYRAHHEALLPATLVLAHAYNSTIHGPVGSTIEEGRLRRATG